MIKKKVMEPNPIPSPSKKVVNTLIPLRIQTAEGWKRSQMRKSKSMKPSTKR